MSIIFKDITKSFNGIAIFEGLSGQIYKGDKIGIVGVNGVGKTTLVKILMGIEEYDSGTVNVYPEDIKVGYLNQISQFDDNLTANEILESIAYAVNSSANSGSYSKKLKNSLIKLGFREKDLNKRVSKLSGGEKTKLSICMVLSGNPDVLILDEPTNHLDMDTIKWLEDFLSGIDKTMIIISHDRLFLDNTVNKIFEMKRNGIKEYRGNYSAYKLQKDDIIKHLIKENRKQERKIKNIEEAIEKRMVWFKRAHKYSGSDSEWGSAFKKKKAKKHINVIRAKQRELERIEKNRVEVPKEDKSAAFNMINKNIETGDKLARYLIRVNRLNKSFGERCLFFNAAFNVENGDKIALLGRNGVGKTTLIRIILGQERADSGTVNINPSVKTGYLSQELEDLNLGNTIFEEVVSAGIDKITARRMLGRFLFNGEDVFKRVGDLSMGERCRTAFAKLLLSGINLLILDEPTNHMDISSREKIEEELKKYEGTVIFVSHDRYLIKNVAKSILEIENQKIVHYKGSYDLYLEKKKEERNRERVGRNYIDIKDEIIRLECEIAFLSAKLGRRHMNELDKNEVERKFFDCAHRLDEYRRMVKA